MVQALGIGGWGALLISVATLTTNFVNIYMSALALRSLFPRVGPQLSAWSTGLVGAALSVFSGAWLDQYANFMLVLGGILVPVGGVLLARFFLVARAARTAGTRATITPRIEDLYDPHGPYARHGGFDVAGLSAWLAGGAAYYAASGIGGTLPALLLAVGLYWMLRRR
jgi:NCS1 family nucleobase:cation symporter-1